MKAELTSKWGSQLTILSLAEDRAVIEAMYGKQESIVDYIAYEILQYLSIKQDRGDYLERLRNVKLNKK